MADQSNLPAAAGEISPDEQDRQTLRAMPLAQLFAESTKRWNEREEAGLDIRIAKRNDDAEALTAANAAAAKAGAAWHRAYEISREGARAAAASLGVDPVALKAAL